MPLPDCELDRRDVMLFGDVYRVNCPRCGETEAVCITPIAYSSVFCVVCGGLVKRENVISFLRSAMLDLEELE